MHAARCKLPMHTLQSAASWQRGAAGQTFALGATELRAVTERPPPRHPSWWEGGSLPPLSKNPPAPRSRASHSADPLKLSKYNLLQICELSTVIKVHASLQNIIRNAWTKYKIHKTVGGCTGLRPRPHCDAGTLPQTHSRIEPLGAFGACLLISFFRPVAAPGSPQERQSH